MDNLLNAGLPKWPQMIVTGSSVTKEQALEIIRRTDSFFGFWQGGNNHEFIRQAKEILQMPDINDYSIPYEESFKRMEQFRDWRSAWGVIDTEYVVNSWISCSFIGGPHGWMHPDGSIGYSDNVGKWPSVEEVYNDWKKIAEAFPFLEIEATLMSGESGEDHTHPVVSFLVREESVELVDPNTRNIHAEFFRTMPAQSDLMGSMFRLLYGDKSCENAISMDQIQKWADEHLVKSA